VPPASSVASVGRRHSGRASFAHVLDGGREEQRPRLLLLQPLLRLLRPPHGPHNLNNGSQLAIIGRPRFWRTHPLNEDGSQHGQVFSPHEDLAMALAQEAQAALHFPPLIPVLAAVQAAQHVFGHLYKMMMMKIGLCGNCPRRPQPRAPLISSFGRQAILAVILFLA